MRVSKVSFAYLLRRLLLSSSALLVISSGKSTSTNLATRRVIGLLAYVRGIRRFRLRIALSKVLPRPSPRSLYRGSSLLLFEALLDLVKKKKKEEEDDRLDEV